MKHFFALLFCGALIFNSFSSKAQSFTVLHDTVYITAGGVSEVLDSIYNTTASTFDFEWKVLSSDFPADWRSDLVFCETVNCYAMGSLFPFGSVQTAFLYPGYGTTTGGQNLFLYSNDLTGASIGCHYLKVRLNNQAIPTDTAVITYLVCNPTSAQVSFVTSSSTDEISYYPNPAINTLNVVYSEMLGVKNIAIFSIIGKQMNMYSTTDNKGAMLSLDNIPSGIYYLRLLNETGGVIATRRFMKQ